MEQKQKVNGYYIGPHKGQRGEAKRNKRVIKRVCKLGGPPDALSPVSLLLAMLQWFPSRRGSRLELRVPGSNPGHTLLL